MLQKFLHIALLLIVFSACTERKTPQLTPWGTSLDAAADTVESGISLDDIVSNGELIMLTISGPDTYYDYHGRSMGTQYRLCEKFAQRLGVSLRVEVCKDTAELLTRLKAGEGDVIALEIPQKALGIRYCGVRNEQKKTAWAVKEGNDALADTLDAWFNPSLISAVKKEESFRLSPRSVTRHVYAPMLNQASGVISKYDHLFQKYAPVARWDWRLLAAQSYQESTFDPQARSWAGACGLMQIMPGTADRLGLPRESLFDPEQNIAAAARYIADLERKMADIPDRLERQCFVLACYNGGYHHIRDAMALAKKHGANAHSWAQVSAYVLKLRDQQYYNDPVVKYGYMRGNETVDYVYRIRERWNKYRGVASGGSAGRLGTLVPQRATRKYRFHL